MGRDRHEKAGSRVGVDGQWFAMPVAFLASRACAELSPLATKMLLMLMGQLLSNHFGNGRLSVQKAMLHRHGWVSTASAHAAIQELVAADLLVATRQGRKGTLGLYGLTLFPMHCESKGLDVGPGAWAVADWRQKPGRAEPPSDAAPAVWNRPRAAAKREACSRRGNETPRCVPSAGMNGTADPQCTPPTGAQQRTSAGNAFPQREPPLRDAISRRHRATASRPQASTRTPPADLAPPSFTRAVEEIPC